MQKQKDSLEVICLLIFILFFQFLFTLEKGELNH